MYVKVCGLDRKALNAFAKAAAAAGLKYLSRKEFPLAGPCLYVGYDNATGEVLAKGEAMAAALAANGVRAYSDGFED